MPGIALAKILPPSSGKDGRSGLRRLLAYSTQAVVPCQEPNMAGGPWEVIRSDTRTDHNNNHNINKNKHQNQVQCICVSPKDMCNPYSVQETLRGTSNVWAPDSAPSL